MRKYSMKPQSIAMRKWVHENPEKKAALDRKYYLRNRQKMIDRMAKWRKDNPKKARAQWVGRRSKNPEAWRGYRYKWAYGITLDDYNKMFKQQGGCCAVCGKHQNEIKRILHVEHNHKTNEIRGLVCSKCNLAIAYLEDKELCLKVTLFLQRFE